ncbi:thioredoxin domain-containing protein [Clostridium oceanicum]|uniref:Thioredoxin domain-containing protein n=1 Tax=Clostridium oceanicum TaxID=1543 RepID=A0ABN1JG15_9CLOT
MSTLTYNKENKLIDEKSPYLLQHAHNPVDWFPWGEEAFQKSKTEDKPIFLSIGYSTCHWCHVMEKESFEDEEVASLLNNNFVSIKVDREERPDIDNIYMTFCQAYTGSGGWPLTIIMDPDKKPFWAGTYLPKRSKYGRLGLIETLDQVINKWNGEREKIVESSNLMLDHIKTFQSISKDSIREGIIEKTVEDLEKNFEYEYGGFGYEPKFPTPHNILFLLRYYKKTKDEKIFHIVDKTLKGMCKGGIFDHVGFGFSRYSTDSKWLVPHFEKMLYDNALLCIAYTEAYNVFKDEDYKDVAEKTLKYVLRDMTSKDGGFYSAEDADSEGVEGKFYLWTVREIKDILGEEDGQFYCNFYDIKEQGNFEGKNIPNLIGNSLNNYYENKEKLEKMREKLFDYREKRVHPYKDDKILTSWNALMISALAIAGRTFKNEEYINKAERAVDFILSNLVDEKGRIYGRYREEERANKGILDDYSFLVWALIEMYESTFKTKYLEKAIYFNNQMIELFYDKDIGGFFLYGEDSEKLIIRPKEIYDGGIPSGNSIALLNMIKLYNITENEDLKGYIDETFNAFGKNINEGTIAYISSIMAYMYERYSMTNVVIAGDKKDKETNNMIDIVREKYLPFTVLTLNDEDENLYKLIPHIRQKTKQDNKVAAYVCKDFTCQKPVASIEKFKELLSDF